MAEVALCLIPRAEVARRPKAHAANCPARPARQGTSASGWFLLNDNMLAQSFYRGLGATEDPEWRRWIMPTHALNRLVRGAEMIVTCQLACLKRMQ